MARIRRQRVLCLTAVLFLLAGSVPVALAASPPKAGAGVSVIAAGGRQSFALSQDGTVRIIKPLLHLDQAVLDALYASRYKPVTYQGRPVTVDYTFNIKLTLPR